LPLRAKTNDKARKNILTFTDLKFLIDARGNIGCNLATQVSFCLCYLLDTKKNRTMFVSTRVINWKAPFIESTFAANGTVNAIGCTH